jgi:DNA-binding SARP family transcriptional activator
MTSEHVLEFRLFGPLEALVDNRSIPLGGPKQRALLTLLLLQANAVVSRDRLVEDLWRDNAPETSANSLAALIARLRRALPADVLITRAGGYELRVAHTGVDVSRFEDLVTAGTGALTAGDPSTAAAQLEAALSLWRGAPLVEFTYEPFAEPTILRLEELRVVAVENRIEADLALGRRAELVPELQSLLLEHPLRERFRGQLMLALYRSGRQAEALAVYREGRQILVDELGIDPSPALQQLEQAILRQDTGIVAPEATSESALTDLHADGAAEIPATKAADEVRPVTVLFADVVGSTALGERLAPEEVKALVGECLTLMSRAVEDFGGTVQYEGDGICAYFGVPVAHADDPERAALSALRVLELVDEYTGDIEAAWGIAGISVRIGINAGRAAVGLVGAADPQRVALGDAANVAARLQRAAEPGTVLVGDAAARRLTSRFVLERLGEVAVRGREAPVGVSRLVAPRTPAPSPNRASMVGRDDELEVLRAALDDLLVGRGQVVLIDGPAGIGKSRLLEELRILADDRATWLEGRCLSYGGVKGWPFMEILLGWLSTEVGEPEIAVRTKARARLGSLLGGELDEVLGPLASLLRIRTESFASGSQLDLPNAYLRWLEVLTGDRPVVLVVEDVEWADAPTRELAEAALALTDRAAIALVFTEQPLGGSEGARLRQQARGAFAHRTVELSLKPLSDEAAAEHLVEILVGDVEPGITERLVREAEGNPLYLEELARAFQEGVLESRERTWTISVRSPELLPPSLENLLVARIDRLAPGPRRLAQHAAAVGRSFPVAVLARLEERDVRDDLAALFRTEIVREVRRYPEFECEFTHGLLQVAALSTLTTTARRDLYRDVAATFEEVYAESLDDHLERLAHYHAQAGNLPKALEYAERARAVSR